MVPYLGIYDKFYSTDSKNKLVAVAKSNNYRDISLISILGKILDRTVLSNAI